MQPRRLWLFLSARACHWLMFSSLSAKTSRSLSREQQLLSYSVPNLYHCGDFFHPWCRHLHVALLNFIIFLLPYSFSRSRSLWMTALLFTILLVPPSLVSSADLMRVYSCCLQVIDKDDRTGPSVDACDALVVSAYLRMECDQFTIQPVFTCPPIQTITVQLGYKNIICLQWWSIHHCSRQMVPVVNGLFKVFHRSEVL